MSQIASAVLDMGFSREDWADSTPQPMDNAFRQLREECQFQQAFFDAQPLDTRRLLEESGSQNRRGARARRAAVAALRCLSKCPSKRRVEAARY